MNYLLNKMFTNTKLNYIILMWGDYMLIANFIISLLSCLILILILVSAYLTGKKGANNAFNKRAQSQKAFTKLATKKNQRR